MHEPPYRVKNMVPGMIMLWAGAIEDIPSGWTLCDGTMDTPDLARRFIRGASEKYVPGGIGGSLEHRHTFTGDGHGHTLTMISPRVAGGTSRDQETDVQSAVGTTDWVSTTPYYHTLCYIMKL